MESVRMGEYKASAQAGDELMAIGLGSCIALALVDRSAVVAALAHIVLPEARGGESDPGKYADLAVPAVIAEVIRAGAAKHRLEAVLVGGARMFAIGTGSMDIGARNEEAVRAALAQAGVTLCASETGGTKGRTVRVVVGESVTAQTAGDDRTVLLDFRGGAARAAALIGAGR
jgi:chemotaxis protein CheD